MSEARPQTRTTGSQIDWGRLVAIGIFSALVIFNVSRLADQTGGSSSTVQGWLGTALTLVFYVLLIAAYLRRSKSAVTDRDWKAWAFGLAATGAPFAIPLLGGDRRADGAASLVSSVALIVGLTFMIWALTYLGTNISVVPQARQVVTTGPYALTRHPLYTAELVNVIGVCLAFAGGLQWMVVPAIAVLQYLRAKREETLLGRVLNGYADYRAQTPMLVPRLSRDRAGTTTAARRVAR